MRTEGQLRRPPARVVLKESPIHGRGLYAAAPIPAGAPVIEYVGERISKQQSLQQCEQGNNYIMGLDDEFDLDGSVDWNLARWINHSCAPNCEAEHRDGGIWIVALRDISAGEELSFNYGYDWTDYREHPCRCGTPACVGYIVAEEFFPWLRERAAAGCG